jgi:hypothetical protein
MALPSFTINFDYRCPFARNANEHVVAALDAGADFDVQFLTFSLSEVHREENDPSVFDDLSKRPELLAVAAGIVVRDRDPEHFRAAHVSLFAARHDDSGDLRDEAVVFNALTRVGVDAGQVEKELADGWPYEVFRTEHNDSVAAHQVFGVPTFIANDQAVFVRLMHRPAGDGKEAEETIRRVVDLTGGWPDLNEFKHTSIPR